jgi:hypothetical protein
MQFFVIDPRDRVIVPVEGKDVNDAFPRAGLSSGQVDHGTVAHDRVTGWSVNIVVSEFSLFGDPEESYYFSIGRHLYAGGAVLYGSDDLGETISMLVHPPVIFYRDHVEVERAILTGQITRPATSMTGSDGKTETFWEWHKTKENDKK